MRAFIVHELMPAPKKGRSQVESALKGNVARIKGIVELGDEDTGLPDC